MELAPIVVSVYTRINHFKQCIEALKKNLLVDKSVLYIYSDAASSIEDEELVNEVRRYAKNIDGFQTINVIERKINYGGTQNASQAHYEITKKYGKSIFLEDDIVTAPGFLRFMNEALIFYANDMRILNISGYCPPIRIPDDYRYDVFLLPRFCGWGCGAFERTVNIVSKKISKLEFDRISDKSVFKVGGEDVLHMIELEVNGKLDAGDVRSMYYQALHKKYTIYPKMSLVQNIGHDGSGEHCRKTSKFYHGTLWTKTNDFYFADGILPDSRIVIENQKFRALSLKDKIYMIFRGTKLFTVLKNIKQLFLGK